MAVDIPRPRTKGSVVFHGKRYQVTPGALRALVSHPDDALFFYKGLGERRNKKPV